MSTRDRAGQTATATSAYAFDLAGGTAAAADLLVFEQAFQVPTVAQMAGICNWFDVPVLVKPTSGAASGEWALMYCTLSRDGAGALTLTSSADQCTATSTFDGTAKTFTALSIANTDTVEVYCVPMGHSLMDLRGRNGLTDPTHGIGDSNFGAPTPDNRVIRAAPALLAIGAGATAGNINPANQAAHAVAIGDSAKAMEAGAYVLGYKGYLSVSYSAILAGSGAYFYNDFEVGSGVGVVELLQAGTTPTWNETQWTKGVMQVATTGTTPAFLTTHDPDVAAAPDTPAITGVEERYVDSGIYTVQGVLTAYDPATNDAKRWFVRFSVKQPVDYSAPTLFGAIDKGTPQEDAALTTADFDVIPDPNTDGSNMFVIEVTGVAAKELVWQFTYTSSLHTVYI